MTISDQIISILKNTKNELNPTELEFFFSYLGGYLSTRLDKNDIETIKDHIDFIKNCTK